MTDLPRYLVAMLNHPLRALLGTVLLLAGCDVDPPNRNTLDTADVSATALDPGTVAVRIGESGPAFDACAIRAVVTEAGDATVPVRAAPFDEGGETVRVANGTRLYVCTRSIDQRWLGVVVVPGTESTDDCGLQARVERPRSYDGPCISGWVPRALVRLTAN
ncbi:hypothetical protein [Sphingomonas japonica]|uniref:Lipoprotein n=1 Tax=Sphingomonas japonica TaxID=511662 RepID=A0ABX0U2E3_9SPHN|nr:hypothetical protein [Sphingomonas japonica]NIJ23871.1 hypothetical protein [Sphingomonas japonica]